MWEEKKRGRWGKVSCVGEASTAPASSTTTTTNHHHLHHHHHHTATTLTSSSTTFPLLAWLARGTWRVVWPGSCHCGLPCDRSGVVSGSWLPQQLPQTVAGPAAPPPHSASTFCLAPQALLQPALPCPGLL
ncbi:hypothetical protein E2C01_025343 [Portunus trituberculatus]|uniref:Uncharacterized protein n=1 Tax=Portunus trituberculatus TaxID=210409 RepID=A0A5B7ED15_PORTR|nr:hypothetical protein [Portunus trituberculatus]